MPASENKILSLAILVSLVAHLCLISPLADWFDHTLLPRFSSESLEIDISEIQSNPLPASSERPEKSRRPAEPDSVNRVSEPEPTLLPEPEPTLLPEPEKTETPEPVPAEPLEPVNEEIQEPLQSTLTKPVPAIPSKKRPLSADTKEDPEAMTEERKQSVKPDAAEKGPLEERRPASPFDEPSVSGEPLESSPPEESSLSEKDRATDSITQIPDAEKPVSASETQRSPLFIEKEATETSPPSEAPQVPDEVRKAFRNDKPEETDHDNLQYSMNSYRWTFERFIDNWVVDIQKWWKAPLDYISGKRPEGGDVWVQVKLNQQGKLLSYKVMQSNVTPEMELKAIQALIGSLKRPELPASFEKTELVINWRFIYPPLRPAIRMRR